MQWPQGIETTLLVSYAPHGSINKRKYYIKRKEAEQFVSCSPLPWPQVTPSLSAPSPLLHSSIQAQDLAVWLTLNALTLPLSLPLALASALASTSTAALLPLLFIEAMLLLLLACLLHAHFPVRYLCAS